MNHKLYIEEALNCTYIYITKTSRIVYPQKSLWISSVSYALLMRLRGSKLHGWDLNYAWINSTRLGSLAERETKKKPVTTTVQHPGTRHATHARLMNLNSISLKFQLQAKPPWKLIILLPPMCCAFFEKSCLRCNSGDARYSARDGNARALFPRSSREGGTPSQGRWVFFVKMCCRVSEILSAFYSERCRAEKLMSKGEATFFKLRWSFWGLASLRVARRHLAARKYLLQNYS